MASVDSNEDSKDLFHFVYGDESVAYEVIRKPFAEGKKKKITIKIHPDGRAIVTAPTDAEQKAIHDAVMRRAKWIWDALIEFRSYSEFVQPIKYVSGEMLFYLGRRYVLKIIEEKGALPTIKMNRGKITVILGKFDHQKEAKTKALVKSWYKVRAEHIFHQRLSVLLPQATWVDGIPSFRVMPMEKQWGSCSAKGTLMLNPHLVKAPKECIDYVILHELCHIAEHNHSEKFWRLLTSLMPHWKEVKHRLDDMAEFYLGE